VAQIWTLKGEKDDMDFGFVQRGEASKFFYDFHFLELSRDIIFSPKLKARSHERVVL